MDPNNPVVKLCAQGMEEESKGNPSGAAECFRQAWDQSAADYERCIAAHYVARHQPDFELVLYWNQLALDCALRIADSTVADFLPSLYLNLAKSHEDLGHTEDARRLYQRAADHIGGLPANAYRDIVQDGINRGLERVGGVSDGAERVQTISGA
jgi:tetratricopeptide (TPR) repeat protein